MSSSETGVDDELAVDAGNAHLAYRTAEGQVGGSESGGGCKACEGVGLGVLVGADEAHLHEHLKMEIIRPQGADGPVDETGYEDLVIRGFAFTLQKTSGETPGGIILFTIIHCEGHEVCALLYFLGCTYGGEHHGASHFDNGRTVRLLGEFAGLDFDHAAVREFDLFVDDVHFYCFLYVFLLKKRMAPPLGATPCVFLL